ARRAGIRRAQAPGRGAGGAGARAGAERGAEARADAGAGARARACPGHRRGRRRGQRGGRGAPWYSSALMADFLPASRLTRSCSPAPAARPAGRPLDPGRPTPLARQILRKVGQAMADFPMIEDGDRVMACVSGGKDSYALLDILLHLRRRAPVRFEVVAVNVDQGWPGYRTDLITDHL